MTKDNTEYKCPLCDVGNMIAYTDGTYNFKYQRRNHTVQGTHYAKCDTCNVTGYINDQLSYNKKLIENYQDTLVAIISPSQIIALREKYSLSQEKASRIFGGGINAFSRWERGVIVPAEPTAKLMLLALEDEKTFLRLAKIANVEIEFIGKDLNTQDNVRTETLETTEIIEQQNYLEINALELLANPAPILARANPHSRTRRRSSSFITMVVDTIATIQAEEELLEVIKPWQIKNPNRLHTLN